MDETKSQDRETIPMQDLPEKVADLEGVEIVREGDPAKGKTGNRDFPAARRIDKAGPKVRKS
jgi:hypothetical protein